MVLETLGYKPGKVAESITVPVFFRIGLRDHLAPPAVVRAVAARVKGEVVVQELNASHIGVCAGVCMDGAAGLVFAGWDWVPIA